MNANAPAADANEQRTLTVDEASELYRDQWILMRVTEGDDTGFPLAGVVVTTSRTREGIQPAVMEHFVHRQPRIPHFVFFGYRRIRSYDEWLRVLQQTNKGRRPRDKQRR